MHSLPCRSLAPSCVSYIGLSNQTITLIMVRRIAGQLHAWEGTEKRKMILWGPIIGNIGLGGGGGGGGSEITQYYYVFSSIFPYIFSIH